MLEWLINRASGSKNGIVGPAAEGAGPIIVPGQPDADAFGYVEAENGLTEIPWHDPQNRKGPRVSWGPSFGEHYTAGVIYLRLRVPLLFL